MPAPKTEPSIFFSNMTDNERNHPNTDGLQTVFSVCFRSNRSMTVNSRMFLNIRQKKTLDYRNVISIKLGSVAELPKSSMTDTERWDLII